MFLNEHLIGMINSFLIYLYLFYQFFSQRIIFRLKMDQMLVEELESDITAARDKLRSIDDKVTTLNGRFVLISSFFQFRTWNFRPPRQRISYNEEPEEAPLRNVGRDAFGLKDEASAWNTRKEIEAPGGVRKRIRFVKIGLVEA